MASPSCSSIPKTPEISHSMLRLWKPQAHRNLRNQWSNLSSLRHQWLSSSTTARSLATSLVNTHLSHSYMVAMDLGVLSDMPNIREKACSKLLKQLVSVVMDMVITSKSMRCFFKTTSGNNILQFSNSSEVGDDSGDGGGVTIVTFLSISRFEMLAEELVEMFKQELILKRLLVVELLSNSCRELEKFNKKSWADELYDGEANDLNICNLNTKDNTEPILPKLCGSKSETSLATEKNLNHDIFQVYLTTWLAEVNIHTFRVEEILFIVGEELRTSFS